MSPEDTHNSSSDNKPISVEREAGPQGWLPPILESAYTRLIPREQAEAEAHENFTGQSTAAAEGEEIYRSRLQPGNGENVFAALSQDLWVDRLADYKRRKAASVQTMEAPETEAAPDPMMPGQNNWKPLGPTVIVNGHAVDRPSVGGRISGIAVVPGGQTVYAASANGGVFKSTDGGMSWHPLTDRFDVNPTNYPSTSLACGAIAIDNNDPKRIYVGTGEGDTHVWFEERIRDALPAYRGIGPIRSDDGGETWLTELTAPGSPGLAGEAFFALAVDPANRENVIAATTKGLYQRVLKNKSEGEWILRCEGVYSSVVVTENGSSCFFAAEWGRGVFRSSDGSQWSPVGRNFPSDDVGRIALGVQPDNPDLVYALIATSEKGTLLGVYRLDGISEVWEPVSVPPEVDVLPIDKRYGTSQGAYDLAIAVDPADKNLIYLGGSYQEVGECWPASIWRCRVHASDSGYHLRGESIGIRAHADVHVLVHTPGDPNMLWVGCDGGIFLNRDPGGSDNFASRNTELACLCPNFFAQHPTDPGIIFCGFQDNGTAWTRGGPLWKCIADGDGGYCLINWADPQQILIFRNGYILRATDGGQDLHSWTPTTDFSWEMMTEPIVGPPYNREEPEDAKVVALGVGAKVYISEDFGETWPTEPGVELQTEGTKGGIFTLTFASASRFFIGTTTSKVFRADRSGDSWDVNPLHNATAGPLGLREGLISDIAIDWADASLASIYIAVGGIGDYRHVWHFDGTRWEARSGSPGNGKDNLLDVEHNAIVVDRDAPDNVYVGANIGVWHSRNRGQTWQVLSNGLPDAPVFDLQMHPRRRLLRASTHGRGLYELVLDPAPSLGDDE
jgi:photosystem II stability/assembly factor-like uncharacterized protein